MHISKEHQVTVSCKIYIHHICFFFFFFFFEQLRADAQMTQL